MVKLLRTLLFCLTAYVLPMQAARADLIYVYNNGVPIREGQAVASGGKWTFIHIPTMDLFYQFYVSPPPPPPKPPKTYRVKTFGRIIDLGDGRNGKAKQQGKDVIISYSDGNTGMIRDATVSLPGEPDPAPPPPERGVISGPTDEIAPAAALADTLLLLAQPGLEDIFGGPIDLSYFKYDFFGTAPIEAFRGHVTFTTDSGLSDTIFVVAEPVPLALAGAGVLAWLVSRRRARPVKG